MAYLQNLFIYGLVLLNLFMLGSSRMTALIGAVGAQSILIICAVAFSRPNFVWWQILFLFGTLLVKGAMLPILMNRALVRAHIRRDVEPLIGYAASLFAGLVLLGAAIVAAYHLPRLPLSSPLAMSAAFFTGACGLLLIVARTKAITQTIGYLTLENGVYFFGFALGIETPLVVESGVLLDVLVGIFVMGIIILQINREFDHIDTNSLKTLRG